MNQIVLNIIIAFLWVLFQMKIILNSRLSFLDI